MSTAVAKIAKPKVSAPLTKDGSRHVAPVSWDGTSGYPGEKAQIVTLYAPAPTLEALSFLHEAEGVERFFWSEPVKQGTYLTLAGCGIATEILVPPILAHADEIAGHTSSRFAAVAEQARELLEGAIIQEAHFVDSLDHEKVGPIPELMRPRLFGGFAFQDDFTPDNTWAVFYPGHFIIPHYQFVQFNGAKFLAINALVAQDEDLDSAIQALEEALVARLAMRDSSLEKPAPATPEWRYPMTPAMWDEMVNSATTAIRNGRIEKVVLFRVCEIKFEKAIDSTAAINFLEQQYQDCYRYLFEPVPYHAFFGATPELLICKHGLAFESMALAGSIARGHTATEDAVRAKALLESAKDRHEHQLVIDGIKRQLNGVVESMIVADEPQILKLRNIQHLNTPIAGRLSDEEPLNILELVERLHPTPALGGSPLVESMTYLREVERVPRGWYAAPIGWIDDQLDGVFAVAIRSAVTQFNRAWLYAGAGIVADSEPRREWSETQLKFKPMLDALGVQEEVGNGSIK
jgi:menaquinone-specific isochorismate synthase